MWFQIAADFMEAFKGHIFLSGFFHIPRQMMPSKYQLCAGGGTDITGTVSDIIIIFFQILAIKAFAVSAFAAAGIFSLMNQAIPILEIYLVGNDFNIICGVTQNPPDIIIITTAEQHKGDAFFLRPAKKFPESFPNPRLFAHKTNQLLFWELT